ncbi:hypothetical protein BYT27DRAFT_7212692 [Phlegmacium glaucopus]|nr:hypothetical protein BYT27DRAFT_7212692 [Phlegmacium glaucopus]
MQNPSDNSNSTESTLGPQSPTGSITYDFGPDPDPVTLIVIDLQIVNAQLEERIAALEDKIKELEAQLAAQEPDETNIYEGNEDDNYDADGRYRATVLAERDARLYGRSPVEFAECNCEGAFGRNDDGENKAFIIFHIWTFRTWAFISTL